MDLFKKELDKAIVKDNVLKFLIRKSKYKNNIPKIRMYADYIIKNTNTSWVSNYLGFYPNSEIILDAVINNYDKIKNENFDEMFMIVVLTKLDDDDLIKYLDKIIPKLGKIYIGYLLDNIESTEVLEHVIDKYIANEEIGVQIVNYLINHKIYMHKIDEHLDEIINNNNNKLFEIISNVNIDPSLKEKLKKSVKDNDKYLDYIITNHLTHQYGKSLEEDEFNMIRKFITLIMKEISLNEHESFNNIEFLGIGTFSYVISLGDKVIKIGQNRGAESFPNNPYIIAPLLRQVIDINDYYKIVIEVTEKVDKIIDVKDEELYELYKNIRDLKLVWTDFDVRNIGRLKKDNVIHWNDPLDPTNHALTLEKSRGNKVLKKGDLVILDADHIYDEKSPEAEMYFPKSPYEGRYQKEKRKKSLNITNEDIPIIEYQGNNDYDESTSIVAGHKRL